MFGHFLNAECASLAIYLQITDASASEALAVFVVKPLRVAVLSGSADLSERWLDLGRLLISAVVRNVCFYLWPDDHSLNR